MRYATTAALSTLLLATLPARSETPNASPALADGDIYLRGFKYLYAIARATD